MFLKAAFKNAPVYVQVLMLVTVIFFGMLLSALLVFLLMLFKMGAEMSPEMLKDFQLTNYPDLLRGSQFFQTLGIFLFPSVVCAWLFSDNYKEYLGVDQPIHLPAAVWAIISMIAAVPFLNWTYALNQQMALPESLKGLETWMKEVEAEAARITELLLNTKNISMIVFNVLIICVVAGVCEEFMFRGLLQTFFGRLIRNPHAVIWTIAILFSAIHFQFYGFITRMLLGAWLGYLMYYTKTLWIPILAHFTNNFFSVGEYYLFQNSPDKIREIDAIGSGSTWWLSIASLALFFFCFTQIKKAVAR